MAERPQGFARRMMAQRLMSDAREDPFSDSRFFSGRIRPSMQDMAEPTRFSDMAMPAYATGATASLFAPGAGVTDIMGFAPDPAQPGEFLPSFGQNVTQGNYLDAGLQALGGAGDVMMAGGTIIPPLALIGTTLKAPRAARVAARSEDVFSEVADFPSLSKSEEQLVAASSAPPEEVAGLGRVITEPIDPENMAASRARFNELQKMTSGYEHERAKARIVKLDDGTDAIQYMEPPATVQTVSIADLKATQPGLLTGGDAALTEGPPLVVKKGGDLFIRDGHHRLARMIEAGADTADVRVIDLDAGGFFGVETAADAAKVAGQAGEVAADVAKVDPNQQMGDALAQAQARYFETGSFEPPTAENPVSVVLPTETEPGIIAFHGSGADFDEFRLEMIGTGEGAQAYGYGLYFTDSEDIAKFYRDALSSRGDVRYGVLPIKYKGQKFSDIEDGPEAEADPIKFRMIGAIFREADRLSIGSKIATPQEAHKKMLSDLDDIIDRQRAEFSNEPASVRNLVDENLLKSVIQERDALERIDPADIEIEKSGKIYKVGLSPKPDELLDYDLPLADQPKIVEKLQSVTEIKTMNERGSDYLNLTGNELLRLLEDSKAVSKDISDQVVAEQLSEAGIPGIKYRAAGSRGAGTADEAAERNYVIFDDRAVKILEKYGIVGPVLVTGGAVAATQRGGDEEGSIFPDA